MLFYMKYKPERPRPKKADGVQATVFANSGPGVLQNNIIKHRYSDRKVLGVLAQPLPTVVASALPLHLNDAVRTLTSSPHPCSTNPLATTVCTDVREMLPKMLHGDQSPKDTNSPGINLKKQSGMADKGTVCSVHVLGASKKENYIRWGTAQ